MRAVIQIILLSCACAAALHSQIAAAQESIADMQSAVERAGERAPGPWQGNWTVLRDDPRIRTLGGARMLQMQVIQDAGSDLAEVQWTADRAICEDPLDDPCEWIGSHGQTLQAVVGTSGLYVPLTLSADETDPFILHLSQPQATAPGLLFNVRGGIRYRLELAAEASTP
jgi:hypothetical protein